MKIVTLMLVLASVSAAPSLLLAETTAADLIKNAPHTNEKVDGIRNYKVVIPGVLYRGGNSGGGAVPLKEKGFQALCDRGFSQAVYMYPNGYQNNPSVSCASGTDLKYTLFGGSIKDRTKIHNFLKLVRNVIVNKQGPILVHCWNGWHSSGEMAAFALMQFCGFNGAQAAQYWQSNVDDKEYTSIQKRIQGFQTFGDLEISAEEQQRVCPQL